MLKKVVTYLVLGLVLVGLLACSVTTPSPAPAHETLTDQEVITLIRNDTEIILNHLYSLAKTHYGKNFLADLLESDVTFEVELAWQENGKQAGKTLGRYEEGQYEPFKGVWREFIDKALFRKITLSVKTSPSGGYVLGHWLIYPDGRIVPSPSALRLEAELVK